MNTIPPPALHTLGALPLRAPVLPTIHAPLPSTEGRTPPQLLKRTCWKYADFMILYRGADRRELYTVFSGRVDPGLIEQCWIDLGDEIHREARARGMKEKDVTAELEARAKAEGLPSATGKEPSFGSASACPCDRDLLLVLGLRLLAGRA